jgi:hypothetical protein
MLLVEPSMETVNICKKYCAIKANVIFIWELNYIKGQIQEEFIPACLKNSSWRSLDPLHVCSSSSW